MNRWMMTLAAMIAAPLATSALAQQPTAPQAIALQAVNISEFGTDFLPAERSAATDGPIDVWLWSFSNRNDSLTHAWGWDSSATRERFDCAAGTMGVVFHETYLAGEYVETVTTTGELKPPPYETKQNLFDYICSDTPTIEGPRFDTVAQARNWADRHFAAFGFGDLEAIQKQTLWHVYHDETYLSAVNIPPPLVAPTQPVQAVHWIIGEHIDGYDTTVGMTTVDCAARSITHSLHAGFSGPDLFGTSPSTDTAPEIPQEDTFDWLLVRHVCDPVETAPQPEYADFKAAQAAYAAARTTP